MCVGSGFYARAHWRAAQAYFNSFCAISNAQNNTHLCSIQQASTFNTLCSLFAGFMAYYAKGLLIV